MATERRYGHDTYTPSTTSQFELERYKEQFRTSTNYGAELLTFLKRSNCGVWRCEQDRTDPRRWWLNITLPTNVAEMFDAHLEIQLLYTEYTTIEPRLLEVIQQRISANVRVDHGLFMIASLDDSVARLLRRRNGSFAGIDLYLRDLGIDSADVRRRMADVLTSIDHYDMTKPVHDPSGFFGRDIELQQITSAISRGQSVGVFGLRKTGKTSLLNFVAKQRIITRRPVVWIDISGIASADEFRILVLEKTWKSVKSSRGELPRLRTLNKNGELKVALDLMRVYWLRDLETLSIHAGSRLEVFIDEVDQLYPDRSHLSVEANEMLIALTQLRGMIQNPEQNSGMVLICAGVDPALFERPILRSGADNLLYKLVKLMFLSPLSRDEMAEMVREIGRRMGVRIRQREVIDFLFDEYGGHALLTRKACSLALKLRNKNTIPWHMTIQSVEAASRQNHDGSPLRQAGEILTSFAEWFPNEASLLRDLWSADREERELGLMILEEDPNRLIHTGPYGLTLENTADPRIRAVERTVRGDI